MAKLEKDKPLLHELLDESGAVEELDRYLDGKGDAPNVVIAMAQELYYMGYTMTDISVLLGPPVTAISRWKRYRCWDDRKPKKNQIRNKGVHKTRAAIKAAYDNVLREIKSGAADPSLRLTGSLTEARSAFQQFEAENIGEAMHRYEKVTEERVARGDNSELLKDDLDNLKTITALGRKTFGMDKEEATAASIHVNTFLNFDPVEAAKTAVEPNQLHTNSTHTQEDGDQSQLPEPPALPASPEPSLEPSLTPLPAEAFETTKKPESLSEEDGELIGWQFLKDDEAP